jgi:4-hydroxybutyrate dehydrogenase
MPAVLQFNRPAITDLMGHAANYLGISGGFDGFCNYVDTLNASLEIPQNLSGLGVENPDIDRIVAGALMDPSTGGNPIEMTKANTTKLLLEIV